MLNTMKTGKEQIGKSEANILLLGHQNLVMKRKQIIQLLKCNVGDNKELLKQFKEKYINEHQQDPTIEIIAKELGEEEIDVVVALVALMILQTFIPEEQKVAVLMAGFTGIVLYLVIDSISNLLECIAEKKAALMGGTAKLGFIGFLYLELIDASFSLDGVLGAFAISKDIIIISMTLLKALPNVCSLFFSCRRNLAKRKKN